MFTAKSEPTITKAFIRLASSKYLSDFVFHSKAPRRKFLQRQIFSVISMEASSLPQMVEYFETTNVVKHSPLNGINTTKKMPSFVKERQTSYQYKLFPLFQKHIQKKIDDVVEEITLRSLERSVSVPLLFGTMSATGF